MVSRVSRVIADFRCKDCRAGATQIPSLPHTPGNFVDCIPKLKVLFDSLCKRVLSPCLRRDINILVFYPQNAAPPRKPSPKAARRPNRRWEAKWRGSRRAEAGG